jgi:Fe-S cluster assembly protein SufD
LNSRWKGLLAEMPVFDTPTGREENWRFTPLDRIRQLLAPLNGDGKFVTEHRENVGVTVTTPASDPRVGSVLTPPDRVSELALGGVEHPVIVTVTQAATASKEPTYLTVRGEGGSDYGHIMIDVEPLAEAVVVVDHTGTGELASNLEMRIGDGASLTLVSVQDWDSTAVHVEAQHAALGRDSRLKHIVVTFGGSLVRIAPTVTFEGPGGDAELIGLSFADADQHLEHRLLIDHAVPRCRSRITYKSVLQGSGAHTVWIGDVVIRAEAEGTDTYELNRNLLLTEGCRADSVPNLEIETGEIAGAGHASATGRFDDEQLFYLRSRGIPADEARRLVVRGFFADVIARIGVPELEQRLLTAIDAELERSMP